MLNKMSFSSPVLVTKQVGNYLFVSMDTISPTATVAFGGGSPIVVGPVFAINLGNGLPLSSFNVSGLNGKVLDINVTTSGKLVLVGSFTNITINSMSNSNCYGLSIVNISNLPTITFDSINWNITSGTNPLSWVSVNKSEAYLNQIWVCGNFCTDIHGGQDEGGGIAQFIETGSTWNRRHTTELSVVSSKIIVNSIAIDATNGILYTTYATDQILNWNATGNGTAYKINLDYSLTRKQFYIPSNYARLQYAKIWYNNGKLYASGNGLYVSGIVLAIPGFVQRKSLGIYNTCANANCAPTMDSLDLDLGVWENGLDPNTQTYANDIKFNNTKAYIAGVINTSALGTRVFSQPLVRGNSTTLVDIKSISKYQAWFLTGSPGAPSCASYVVPPANWATFAADPVTYPGFPSTGSSSVTYNSTNPLSNIFICYESGVGITSAFLNSSLQTSTSVTTNYKKVGSYQSGGTVPTTINDCPDTSDLTALSWKYICPSYCGNVRSLNGWIYNQKVDANQVKHGYGNSVFVENNLVNVFGNFATNSSCGPINGFSVSHHLILDSSGKQISYMVA